MKVKHVLVTLILSVSVALAQTGKIAGVVVDSRNGEGLIGANVYLEGTSYGAATDYDGNYVIVGIPEGSYELVVMMIGYAELHIQNVKVVKDDINRLDITLNPEVLQTEVVKVEAKSLKNTEGSLLKLRQKAASVSDAISAEEISRAGSGDAAAAMKKVTGASVVGGKYVYIRGLGERYSATTLNGAELPSADPDKKSFQLDLIPSNMLDNINTIKTFTPDKPGTFTGGLVDVSLKSYPEQLSIQVSTSTGYNSVATGSDNFLLTRGSNTDWLGIDNGYRDLPSVFSKNKNTEETPRSINRLYRNGEEDKARELAMVLDQQSSVFKNEMVPVSITAPVNSSLQLSIGNSVSLDDDKKQSIGYFGSLSWGQNYTLIENAQAGRYKLNAEFDNAEGLEPEFVGNGTKGIREINWGSIANLAYKNADLGQFKFSYMHTQSADAMGQFLVGYRRSDRTTQSSQRTFETSVVSWKERSVDNYQLDGEHLFSFLNNSKLDWKVAYISNDQLEPDQKYFFNIYDPQPDGSIIYSFDLANSQPISRYYRDLNENTFSHQINYTFPFEQWSGKKSSIKIGYLFADTERKYNQRRFDYDYSDVRLNDFNDNGKINYTALFNRVGISDSTSSERPGDWFDGSMLVNESIDSTNFFSGSRNVMAYYAMIDMPVVESLRFIGGARVEHAKIESKTLDPEDGQGNLNDTDVLPSLNLVFSVQENMNVRAAFTKTIARPTFRELAPYKSFEFVGDYLFEGNPNLQRTNITNYDLRWEWFINPGEIIAVSGFYKDFKNPIEYYFEDLSGDDGIRRVQNVQHGRVYGLEFEVRKSLGLISEVLSDFRLGANLSLVQAEVDVPEVEIKDQILNGNSDPEKTRPFPGQSPYLYNLNLTYDNYVSNTSAGIFYNTFGKRLFLVGRNGTPNVFEEGYGTLDFKVTQGIAERYQIALSVKNLLDPDQDFTYTLKNDLVNKEYIYQRYKRGVTYILSLGYKI